ncbi:MAG: hypothetical protein ABII64_08350 [Elusimicrobiota bacterium]
MKDKLSALIEYCKTGGRVCPMPTFWNELWEMLPDRKQKLSGGWEPAIPLILAAWWDTPKQAKIDRLAEHINYAAAHGFLDKVGQFLMNLKPAQWAYGDGVTDWKEYKSMKNIS